MYKIVFIRHGQSLWNKANKFTGWTNVDLSEQGIAEAKAAGQRLKAAGFDFDMGFTSYLMRASKTLALLLKEMELEIPISESWKLNERHYGALQGENKSEVAKKVGEEQVHIWRRSFDTPPPALELKDPRHPSHDERYAELSAEEMPTTESLKDTIERVVPYWDEMIAPEIKAGKHIIIAAHGNSLRALLKHLDQISDQEITKLSIPTGQPLVYELDDNLKPIKSYYLD